MMITALAFLAATQPFNLTFADQWSRTQIPKATSCGYLAGTGSTTPRPFLSGADGSTLAISFPSQLMITNDSGEMGLFCLSQDPDPTISQFGAFSADADSFYPAGPGSCIYLGPGTWPIGVVAASFPLTGYGKRVAGSRPYRCSNNSRSCAVTGECSGGGTCAAANGPPISTYLFAYFDTAVADVNSRFCVTQ